MLIAIALHYPVPAHEAAFLAYMGRVIAATAGAPGLHEFRAYRDTQSEALAGFSCWESEAAFRVALAPIGSRAAARRPEPIGSRAAARRPEWSVAPDRLLTLVEA